MKEDKLYEVVECCPYCDHENIYNVPLNEIKRHIRTCQKCGKKIFICSECLELEEGRCNWHKNPDGSQECFCGKIVAKGEKKNV